MAAYLGILATDFQSLPPNGLSVDLSGMAWASNGGLVRDQSFSLGMNTFGGPISVVHQAIGGSQLGLFDGVLFENILVMPRKLDAGFVLSSRVFAVEVWNAHMATEKPLDSIFTSGPGNLSIVGPASMSYGPGQSQGNTANLPATGDAAVQSLATWSFPGESGADLAVNGFRITMFAHRPDWAEPFRERIAWLTEILTAYNGSEQRRGLRQAPRYSISYRVQTTDPLETATLEALLYGWQAQQFGVPIWPESTPLLSSLTPGNLVISADLTLRPSFQAGGLVMVWSDFATWECFQISSLTGSVLNLASQVTKAWAAGARVVPVRRGRLQSDQPVGRPTNWLSSGSFAFTCEAI